MTSLKAPTKNHTKIPADLADHLDALLIIETIDDAKELIANPDIIENLDFHEGSDASESDENTSME